MIAHLQRASNTAGLLAYLYGPGERGDQSNPRLVGGDCHGAPIDLLTHGDTLPSLVHALDAPVERLGTRAPERPVWVCSVRSDPRHPDLADAQWAEVASRLAAVTVAPDGDPGACRWIALRNQPCQVHVVATLAREDGQLHNAYRDAFHLQRECRRIAAELGHLPASPVPTPLVTEKSMPITVTIATEPSGSVVARGGDSLAKSLLDHAGFAFANDWHGPCHRLPTSMGREEQAVVASRAAEMLRAARYAVELDPVLDTAPPRGQSLGDRVLAVTDRIRGAGSSAELADALAPLLHAEHGVVEQLREALEAAGEQITDLDDEEYQLGDRFGFASEFLTAAEGELVGWDAELRRVAVPAHERAAARSAAVHDARSAALATSPAAAQVSTARNTTPAVPATAPPASPAHDAAPRNR